MSLGAAWGVVSKFISPLSASIAAWLQMTAGVNVYGTSKEKQAINAINHQFHASDVIRHGPGLAANKRFFRTRYMHESTKKQATTQLPLPSNERETEPEEGNVSIRSTSYKRPCYRYCTVMPLRPFHPRVAWLLHTRSPPLPMVRETRDGWR